MSKNSQYNLLQSSENNYHLIIQTVSNENTLSYVEPTHQALHKVSFHESNLGASFTQASSSLSVPFDNNTHIKHTHQMDGDIFFFFGIFCLLSVIASFYFATFSSSKNH